MDRCHGCYSELEGGRVLHRSHVFCSLSCALDHYDSELVAARGARAAVVEATLARPVQAGRRRRSLKASAA